MFCANSKYRNITNNASNHYVAQQIMEYVTMSEILDRNYYFSNENLKKTFNNLVKTIAMTWFHRLILIISGVWTWFCTKTDWCNQPWHMNQDGDTTPTIRGNDLNDNEKTHHVQLRSWYLKIFFVVRKMMNSQFFLHKVLFLYNDVFSTSYYINTSAVKSSSVCMCNFILILQLFSIFGEKIEHYFEFDYPTQRQRSHNSFLLYVLMLSKFCLGNKLL